MDGISRDTTDPLIKLLVEKYSLHLLKIPRAAASIGDLFLIQDPTKPYPPATTLKNIFNKPFDAEEVMLNKNEPVADVNSQSSHLLELHICIKYLTSFLNLFIPSLAVKITGKYSKVRFLRLSYGDVTCDRVNLVKLQSELNSLVLSQPEAIISDGRKYYVVTEIWKTKSVRVEAFDKKGKEINITFGVGEIDLKHMNIMGGLVTYSGSEPLVFGVVVNELKYEGNKFALDYEPVTDNINLRAGGDNERLTPAEHSRKSEYKPAFIGDRQHGDAFTDPYS